MGVDHVERVLAQRRAPGRAAAVVEIVHESLLVTWGLLARWLEESGEERRLLVELDEATGYCLTALGRELLQLFLPLHVWSERWARSI